MSGKRSERFESPTVFYTLSEAARYLNWSYTKVRTEAGYGELTVAAVTAEGAPLFSRADVVAMKAQEQARGGGA